MLMLRRKGDGGEKVSNWSGQLSAQGRQSLARALVVASAARDFATYRWFKHSCSFAACRIEPARRARIGGTDTTRLKQGKERDAR